MGYVVIGWVASFGGIYFRNIFLPVERFAESGSNKHSTLTVSKKIHRNWEIGYHRKLIRVSRNSTISEIKEKTHKRIFKETKIFLQMKNKHNN